MGVELGKKAAEKKVTAALSLRQIPDLLSQLGREQGSLGTALGAGLSGPEVLRTL